MRHRAGFYEKYGKRFLDFFLSGMALIILSPVLLVTAILVRVKLGSPVIFCQERPGKDEQIFKLHKFRSMSDARDEHGELLPDQERLGKFGRILRATSLDELPELWDIFCGKMSLVGPRPLLVKYLPLYNDEQHYRHAVRPGLTAGAWPQSFLMGGTLCLRRGLCRPHQLRIGCKNHFHDHPLRLRPRGDQRGGQRDDGSVYGGFGA